MLHRMIRCGAGLGGTLALALLAAATAHATTFMPTTFDDPLFGGTACTPPAAPGACSLRHAINSAQNGDTVKLQAGTYTIGFAELTAAHAITLIGAGPGKTTIKQTAPEPGAVCAAGPDDHRGHDHRWRCHRHAGGRRKQPR